MVTPIPAKMGWQLQFCIIISIMLVKEGSVVKLSMITYYEAVVKMAKLPGVETVWHCVEKGVALKTIDPNVSLQYRRENKILRTQCVQIGLILKFSYNTWYPLYQIFILLCDVIIRSILRPLLMMLSKRLFESKRDEISHPVKMDRLELWSLWMEMDWWI